MTDLAFEQAVDYALDELDAAAGCEDLCGGRPLPDQVIVEIAIRIGTALVYATLAVAEAIAAASEDALTDVVDERVDVALAQTLEIAAELEHDPDADTGVIEVAS